MARIKIENLNERRTYLRIADIGYTNSEITHIADEYIHSERDRLIIKRRYVDGITIDGLADEFNLSVDAIKRVIRKNDNLFVTK